MYRRHLVLALSVPLVAGCLGSGGGVEAEGRIRVNVDGSAVDLTRERYQSEHAEGSSRAFHLHEGDQKWYMEGSERVTIAEAIDLLPQFAFDAADEGYEIGIDGRVYDGSDPSTTVIVTLNGDPVDPAGTKLQDGDDLAVEINTS